MFLLSHVQISTPSKQNKNPPKKINLCVENSHFIIFFPCVLSICCTNLFIHTQNLFSTNWFYPYFSPLANHGSCTWISPNHCKNQPIFQIAWVQNLYKWCQEQAWKKRVIMLNPKTKKQYQEITNFNAFFNCIPCFFFNYGPYHVWHSTPCIGQT